MHFLAVSLSPVSLAKSFLRYQQATALDLPFYDIFAPQKVSILKISDDVLGGTVICGLGLLQSKILATPMWHKLKKSELVATSILKLIKMMLKWQVAKAFSKFVLF